MNLNLQELKKRFIPEEALAITVESGRVAVALVSPNNGGRELFTLPIGADAIVSDPEKAGKEFAAALATAGVRQRRCVVCVPPAWALTAAADLPEMADEDLRSFLELRAEKEFPISADEMRIGHSPYTLPDGKRRTTLAAIPLKRMEGVEKMLAAAGCRAVSISLALDECLAEPKPALHFLANGTHTNVVVTAGGGVVSMRSLATAAPTAEAPFDSATFNREVRITLGRLPEPVRQQVREARFSGSPASAKRLCDSASAQLLQLGIESIDCAGDAGAAGANGESGHPAAAVKAAQYFLRKQPVAFEYVVPEVKQWEVLLKRANLHRRRKLILAGVVAIAIPLLCIFVRGQEEGYYTRRWKGMSAKYAELTTLQQKIRAYQPWFKSTPVTVQTIEMIATAFPEQGDVWAKDIQILGDGRVICTGFTRNQNALIALKDRLSAVPGVSAVAIPGEHAAGTPGGAGTIQFTITLNYDPRQ